MSAVRLFYDETELARLRRKVVLFWISCAGIDEWEIASRLNLTVSELRYIFPEQLDDGPFLNPDAVLALYYRALAGDAEAMVIWLTATWWRREPFTEMLSISGRVQ